MKYNGIKFNYEEFQKLCRVEQLCFRCGSGDHRVAQCPSTSFLFSRKEPADAEQPCRGGTMTVAGPTHAIVTATSAALPKAGVSSLPPLASFTGIFSTEVSDEQHHQELIEAEENWAYWDEFEESDGECAMGMGVINRLDLLAKGQVYPLIDKAIPEEDEMSNYRSPPIGVPKDPVQLETKTEKPKTAGESFSSDIATSRQYIQCWGNGVPLMALLDTGAACNFMPRAIYLQFFSHIPLQQGEEVTVIRGLLDFEDQCMDGVVSLQILYCGMAVEASFPVGQAPDIGVVLIGQALMDKFMLSIGYDSRRNRVCKMGYDAHIVPSYHRQKDKFVLVQRNHRANAPVGQLYCPKNKVCILKIPVQKETFSEGTTLVIEPERTVSGLEIQAQLVKIQDGKVPLVIYNFTDYTQKVNPTDFRIVAYRPREVVSTSADPVEAITEDPEILTIYSATAVTATLTAPVAGTSTGTTWTVHKL